MSCDTRVENHDSGSVGSGERGYECDVPSPQIGPRDGPNLSRKEGRSDALIQGYVEPHKGASRSRTATFRKSRGRANACVEGQSGTRYRRPVADLAGEDSAQEVTRDETLAPTKSKQQNSQTKSEQQNSQTKSKQQNSQTKSEQQNSQTKRKQQNSQTKSKQQNSQTKRKQQNSQTKRKQQNSQTKRKQQNSQTKRKQQNSQTKRKQQNSQPKRKQQNSQTKSKQQNSQTKSKYETSWAKSGSASGPNASLPAAGEKGERGAACNPTPSRDRPSDTNTVNRQLDLRNTGPESQDIYGNLEHYVCNTKSRTQALQHYIWDIVSCIRDTTLRIRDLERDLQNARSATI
ncbi:micronuclear linker histone polyprotein-like [Penaeus japonicus]|uniref:micronuclear linker histone polyprotein-like n=1 Tax=Penaeus japonicus TaxID=27405 RepID=UPI001C712C9C|nr:micronuclear linker histone polyprotein-like [Penaeus japonicus]